MTDRLNVRDFGAVGDGTTNDTPAIQAAVNALSSAGGVVWVPASPAPYVLDGQITIEKSHVVLLLDAGAYLKQTQSVTNASTSVVSIEGSVTSISGPIGADIRAQQQDGIIIDNISVSLFHVGDWVLLEDNLTSGSVGGHAEINRLRTVEHGKTEFEVEVTFYYPVTDSYLESRDATLTKLNIVENSGIRGGGRISNTGIDASTGGHGVRLQYGVGCFVDGIEVSDVRNQGVKLQHTLSCRVANCYIHDAPVFEVTNASNAHTGEGYGISITSAVGTVIAGNCIARTRHAIDISYFSRQAVVTGNECRSGAFTPIQVHPACKRVVISGNTVDGARGYVTLSDPSSSATEMADGEGANGIAVREENEDILIAGNSVSNVNLSGIALRHHGCRSVRIVDNILTNVNIRGVSNHAGIWCGVGTNGTGGLPGLVIASNSIVSSWTLGIFCSFPRAVIDSNRILELRRGIDSPGASPGAADFAWGIVVGPRGDEGSEQIFGPTDVSITRNLVEGVANVGVDRGIVVGSVLGLASSFSAGTLASSVRDTLVLGNRVRWSRESAIIAAPAKKTYGSHTASVTISGFTANENTIDFANQTDEANSGGIVAIEEVSLGVDFGPVCIARNDVGRETMRHGVLVGCSGALVSGNRISGIGLEQASTGSGITVRSRTSAPILHVRVIGNCCERSYDDGIAIGVASGTTGLVTAAIVNENLCRDNNRDGIREEARAEGCVYAGNACVGNGSQIAYQVEGVGLRILGDASSAINNMLFDVGTGTQAFGLDVGSSATDVQCTSNRCYGNVDDQTRDTGAGTLFLVHPDIAAGTVGFGTNAAAERIDTDGLFVNGRQRLRRRVVTAASDTMGAADRLVVYTSAPSARTFTLQSAAAAGSGRIVEVKNESSGSGPINITAAGSDVIDGAAQIALGGYGTARLYSDGTSGWYRLA